MKVLVVHEGYFQKGGEDVAVEADVKALRAAGHRVDRWTEGHDDLLAWPAARKLPLLWRTMWSRPSYETMLRLIDRHRPDLVHFHNTLPLISPAAIHAAHRAGVPVVMTLHNYRLLCPAGTLFRKGRVCEECSTHSLIRSVYHNCYRNSKLQTAALSVMLGVHRYLGTWWRRVDAYIAPTAFVRTKLHQNGLPRERIHVRPNAVSAQAPSSEGADAYCVFVGRLSQEKGISTLLQAIRLLPECSVKVIGSGPLDGAVEEVRRSFDSRLEHLGFLPHDAVLEVLRRARLLICPSVGYETFALCIVEALACGVPVVASRLGAMAEIITDGREGFLFRPGDPADLADKVRRIMADDDLRERMSRAARATFEARYSPERSYEKLMEIYRIAIASARARRSAA